MEIALDMMMEFLLGLLIEVELVIVMLASIASVVSK